MKKTTLFGITMLASTFFLTACSNSSQQHQESETKVSQSNKVKKKKQSAKRQTTSERQQESSQQKASVISDSSNNQSQAEQATSESVKKETYSITGTWQDQHEKNSNLTFKADGNFEKYSATAGFKITGTYQIVSQEDNTIVVKMLMKYPNGQSEEQTAQYKFTNEHTLVAGNQQYIRNN